MGISKGCVFCDRLSLKTSIIRSERLFTSFVSVPGFRSGHCLVIPNRHVCTVGEITKNEGAAILLELGRLSSKLDEGYGTGIMQKYQPLQVENGIKVDHLHFHVFPRQKKEAGLFPVPELNSFEGFKTPTNDEVAALVQRLK